VPLPPLIEHRLNRTRRLLERAAVAGPVRQRRLQRIARVRLARLDALVARRLGGECEIEVRDLLERAAQCTVCVGDDDGPSDDRHGDDDNSQGDED
jgi:hypothetical protein